MIAKEVLKKIRRIEIQTPRLASGTHIGQASSAQKGTGLEFDQLREYQFGDDIRFIDWKSSARMNKILVKQYIAERHRTIFLIVDGSSSTFYGSTNALKFETMAEIASVLALVSNFGKDQVGLILFGQEIELLIPPFKGTAHIHRIMEALFTYKPKKSTKTNLKGALEFVAKLKKRNHMLFCISDFIATNFEKPLSLLSHKHDFVAIRCLDKNEIVFPNVGLLPMQDDETGQTMVLDTRIISAKKLKNIFDQRIAKQNSLFKKYGIDCVDIQPGNPFIGSLIRVFRQRMQY